MCLCNPSIRTPWCDKCRPKNDAPMDPDFGVPEVTKSLEEMLRNVLEIADEEGVNVKVGTDGKGFLLSYNARHQVRVK